MTTTVPPTPIRLQRSRAKGWRMISPNGLPCRCVTRPGKYGNPFKVGQPGITTAAEAVNNYAAWIVHALASKVEGFPKAPTVQEIQNDLRGKNLFCYCGLGDMCHADWLLTIANRDQSPGVTKMETAFGSADLRATFSPCRTYRYTLIRELYPPLSRHAKPSTACWIMLNPSTADERIDDPTIRRCMGFAEKWGHTRIVVVNLFAFRSTNPKALYSRANPEGNPENDAAIVKAAGEADLVVAAWGAHGRLQMRGSAVLTLLESAGIKVNVLRLTADGQPGHPLYLPGNLTPKPLREESL